MLRQPAHLEIDDGTSALTASHAVHGVAIDIEGVANLTLHCAATGTGDTELKLYVVDEPTAAAPAAVAITTHLIQLPAGTATAVFPATFTIATDAELSFPLPSLSGKWLMATAKYSATDGACSMYVTGQV